MIILGVTGSVGMGKTEASKYFIKNNIDVFDCDKEIATFYNKKDIIIEIKKNFPNTIYNNKVDKNALAKIVFNDKSKLNLLEGLLYKKLPDRTYPAAFEDEEDTRGVDDHPKDWLTLVCCISAAGVSFCKTPGHTINTVPWDFLYG